MVLNTETNRQFCYNYHGSAAPFWASPTTISVAWIAERDQGNTTNLVNTSSTTLATTTSGANGILASSTLAGTVSNGANSTTVTGTGTTFQTSFIVGDVICVGASPGCMITAIASNTSLTVNTAISSANTSVTYVRGGRSYSTVYYLYAIAQAGGSSVSLALSTRAVNSGDSLVDLPAGYTLYRQLAFASSTDINANMNAFRVAAGWPYTPTIYYDIGSNPGQPSTQIFSASLTTTGTTYSCSGAGLVPIKVSQIALLNSHNFNSAGSGMFASTSSGSSYSGQLTSDTEYSYTQQTRVLVNSNGTLFFYMTNATTSTRTVYVSGFIITLVP
jgi:hypothetical protein